MKYKTGLKKGSLDRNLSVIISILGMSSFVIWTLLLVLLVIGNIIYWSGFPYDLGSTSEYALWGGWAHLVLKLWTGTHDQRQVDIDLIADIYLVDERRQRRR